MIMSLFDKLPFELTDKIYKLSLKEHINSIPQAVLDFHLKCANKKIIYRIIKFRKFHRFTQEIKKLFDTYEKVNKKSTTILQLQTKLFWYNAVIQLASNNRKLISLNCTGGNECRLLQSLVQKKLEFTPKNAFKF